MSVRSSIVTFVLTLIATSLGQLAHAAPPAPSEVPIDTKTKKEVPAEDQPTADEYNLIATPSTPVMIKPPPQSGFYPYRKAISVRFLGAATTESDPRTISGIGVSYLWPRFRSPQAELGADVVTDDGGHLNFGVKYTLRRQNFVRPYYLWGLTHEVVAKDGLASFVDFENYYLRVATGIEIVASLPYSVRVDIEGLAGTEKQMIIVALGATWGW